MRTRRFIPLALVLAGALAVTVAFVALLLAAPAANASGGVIEVQCESDIIRAYSGSSCLACRYNICCVVFSDFSVECEAILLHCWDCGGHEL